MRQTLRQIVAVLALIGMSMSIAPTTFAASYSDASAANKLAAAGIIQDHSAKIADYRLGDNVLRQEAVGIAGRVSGVIPNSPVSAYNCQDMFSDISEAWVCRAAELAAAARIVNANNTTFRPMDKVTRYEAVVMALKASCLNPVDASGTTHIEQTAARAVEAGLISNAASFNPNAVATRGDVFRYNVYAMDYAETNTDEMDDSLPTCAERANGGEGGNDILCVLDPSFCATEENTTTGGTSVTGGSVNVSAGSAPFAAGTTLPIASGITVGKLNLTAGSTDVSITAIRLMHKGVGVRTEVASVGLFSNGAKVAKSKAISSEDTVDLNMIAPLVIKAGTTTTVDVVVSTATGSGEHYFQLAADGITSSASSVGGSFPINTTLFKNSTTSAGTLTFSTDGSLADVKLGQTGAVLAKFKVATSSVEDITIKSMTFKKDSVSTSQDSDIANYKLYLNGSQVATGVMVNKYVTFALNTTILKNKSDQKFEIRGDVVGGASKTLKLVIDSTTDITANGSQYLYGANTSGTTSAPATTVNITAGAVSLVREDAVIDKVIANKKDVVFGKIKITPNSGKDVELSTLKLTIDTTLDNSDQVDVINGEVDVNEDAAIDGTDDATNFAIGTEQFDIINGLIDVNEDGSISAADDASNLVAGSEQFDVIDGYLDINESASISAADDASDLLFVSIGAFTEIENLELYNETTNQIYDLAYVSGGASKIYSNTDMGLILRSGTTYSLVVRADTKVAAVDGDYTVRIANATGGDLVLKEVANDTTVTDITPNALSLKKVSIATSSFTMTQNALSSAINGVIGSSDIELINFNIKANDVGSVKIRELKFADEAAGTLDNTLVSGFKLWKIVNGTATLVKEVGTSDLASQELTVRDLNEIISANTTVRYALTTSLVKDSGEVGETIKVRVSGYSAENTDGNAAYTGGTGVDSDSDGVITAAQAGAVSARTVTAVGTGSFSSIAVDTIDSAVSKDKNVLANTTTDFVAAYKLSANNEGIKVKDIDATFSSDVSSSVDTLILYRGDKVTEIGREAVTGATVQFRNIANYVIAEGTESIYAKLVTRKIGKNEAGAIALDKTLTLTVVTAEGASSGDDISAAPVDVATSASKAFSVVPTRISSVAFVSSNGGENVVASNSLSSGVNQIIGIVAITADTTTNTNSSGAILKAALTNLEFTIAGDATNDYTGIKITRIGGADTGGEAANTATFTNSASANSYFVMSNLSGGDNLIEGGQTAYFKIEATPVVSQGLSVQVSLPNLDSATANAGIDYDSDAGSHAVSKLNIGQTTITGPSISRPN